MTACAPRFCSDERCGKPLPVGAAASRLYCDKRCCERASARVKARAAGKREYKQPAFIRDLRREVPEGHCVYCKAELTTRQKFCCAARACRDAYSDDHRREKRASGGDTETASLEAQPTPAEECAAEFRESTLRLSLQLDALRAGVRELCHLLSCEVRP